MPRLLLCYLTFPGIIVHEFAHAWACRRLGIPVERVCYLRLGNPMGYVLHARPASVVRHILIVLAPFFVSSTVALAAGLGAALLARSRLPPESRDAVSILALWLAFSAGLHAFPSSGDADALRDEINSPERGLLAKALLIPVLGMLRLIRLGSRFWLDILFALAMVGLAPTLLLILTAD